MNAKEKKEWIIFAVIAVVTLGVIYFNFLKPKPEIPAPLLTTTTGTNNPTTAPAGTDASAAATLPGGSGAGAVSAAPSGFLPYGSKLDFQILNDTKFNTLIPPSYPTVTKEELGKDNAFAR